MRGVCVVCVCVFCVWSFFWLLLTAPVYIPHLFFSPDHRSYIVAAWLGPISSLLYLPKRQQQQHMDDGEVMVLDGEEANDYNSDDQLRPQQEEEQVRRWRSSRTSLSQAAGSATTEEEGEGLDSSNGSSRGDISMHKLKLPMDDDDDLSDGEEEGERLLFDEATAIQLTPSQEAAAEEEENYNLVQMLKTPSALLMLWTTTILVGAGTVETNNMGDMVESLGFPDKVTPAALALFSVAQAAGRVATGAVSEAALNWKTQRFCIDNGVPRPFFLLVASCVGFFAHFLLGFAANEFLFVIGAAFAGAAFGMVWPLMVLIVGEVFGTANAGANYMFYDGFTSAAGTLLLTKFLAQHVYESHIDPASEDHYTCLGLDCFQATHMVVAFLSLSCAGTSAAMLYTSRHTYNKSSLHRA